ncbi:kinase-like domain-containing protein, partial [Tribonema minus]
SHIVAFHDAYTDPIKGSVCMVMEYMDAGTLQQFVQSKREADEGTLAAVARGVLKGLAAMHAQHRIHRDIKPSNILLDRRGRIKIGDFGVTRELGATASLASTFTGTLTYMSPERINSESYSYPSDIWSLGLVLVTLALGYFPLQTQVSAATTPRHVLNAVTIRSVNTATNQGVSASATRCGRIRV